MAADVGAVQRRLGGMHQHAWLHVIDPEVLFAAVAQGGHGAQRHLLGLVARQLAGLFLLVGPAQHTGDHLHGLARGVTPRLCGLVNLDLGHPAHQRQQGHHQCQGHQQRLGGKAHAAQQAHARPPDAQLFVM
jgi:hypothetical protein